MPSLKTHLCFVLICAVIGMSFAFAGSIQTAEANESDSTTPACNDWRPMDPPGFRWWNLPFKLPLREQEEVKQLDFGLQCIQKQLRQLSEGLRADFLGMARASDATLSQHNIAVENLTQSLQDQHVAFDALVNQVSSLTVVISQRQAGDVGKRIATLTEEIRNQQQSIQQLNNLVLQSQSSVNIYNQAAINSLLVADSGTPVGPVLAPPHDLKLDADIQKLYGESRTNVSFAIVTLPDPRVPRHHRAYDTDLTALTDGMIRAGFVLDDFNFPWDSDPDTVVENLGVAAKTPKPGPKPEQKFKFGLMAFRRDCWRGGRKPKDTYVACPSLQKIEIRALYVVPERATSGLDVDAFRQAVTRISKQPAWLVPNKRLHLVVFGPAFSGSMDSLIRAVGVPSAESPEFDLAAPTDFKVISAAATAGSNSDATSALEFTVGPSSVPVTLSYEPLTLSDDSKLQALRSLAASLGIKPPEKLAIIYESTVFGLEAARKRAGFDDDIVRIPVPVNIADVRYGFADKNSKAAVKTPVDLPQWEQHLALDEGAENGTEFPREKSLLTPTSSELALHAVLDTIHHAAYRIVAVAATDVRDRLFLFDQLRGALPGAMFVDLGTDRLLSHADFVHASRGVLTLGSSELDCSDPLHVVCAASTDYQSLLADGIRQWADNSVAYYGQMREKVQIHWHLVTRTGLVSAQKSTDGADRIARFGRDFNRPILLGAAAVILVLWGVTAVGGVTPKNWLRKLPSVEQYPVLGSSRQLMLAFKMSDSSHSTGAPETARATISDRLQKWLVQFSATLAVFLAVAVLIQGDSSWALAFVTALFVGWYLSWKIPLVPWQYHVAIFCLAAALALILSFGVGLINRPEFDSHGLGDLEKSAAALGLQWRGGLANTSGFCIALVCLLGGFSLNMQAGSIAQKHWELFQSRSSGRLWLCSLAGERPMLTAARIWILLAVVIVTFEAWRISADGVRLTVFGTSAGVTMLIALVAITLLGLAMLVLAVGKSLGMLALCRMVPRCVNEARQSAAAAAKSAQSVTSAAADSMPGGEFAEAGTTHPAISNATIYRELTEHTVVTADTKGTRLINETEKKELSETRQISGTPVEGEVKKEEVLRFEKNSALLPDFLVTPILVLPGAGGTEVEKLRANMDKWGKSLCELLDQGIVKDNTLLALFALLIGEIGLIQLAIVGVMLTSLTATALVFVFPISDGDGLLLLNLGILTLSGIFSGLVTIRFETDEVLSWVLCNRERKAEFSLPLFGYVAFPFAILAVAIAIADIPGVLNWGGSIFSAMLEITKPGGLK